MKTLLNKNRMKQLKELLKTRSYVLSFLFFIVGVVGIALFADLRVNQNTFVSENALLPGYVVTKYRGEHTAAMLHKEYSALLSDGKRRQWISGMFKEYGLEVYSHNFTVKRPLFKEQLKGENIFAIYRAPKTPSTEALVFSTTLRANQNAIPLMLSIVDLISKQTIWAKDIIFLIAEHDEFGVGAFLQSYHDIYTSDYIKSHPLLTHSGAIQAAIHINMPVYHFDRLRMYVEAMNGQLPDIDLVVLVRQICRQENIHLLLRNSPHDVGDFKGNLIGLHANMAWQAAGRVAFPSALYHPYNIHAVGIETELRYGYRYKWGHMGRFTESVLRSINNLEEQFHTAYYFYLMPCVERFVSLSVYMVPCGLILAASAVRILSLWFSAGTITPSENFFISQQSVNVIDCVYPFLLALCLGVLNELISISFHRSNILLLIGMTQIITVVIGCFSHQREDWRLHQAFALLVHVLAMVLLCMLNISLTIFYAIPTTIAYLLQFPFNKPVRVIQRALLLAANPALLVVFYAYLYVYVQLDNETDGFFEKLQTLVTETIESNYTLGVWTWKAYSCLLLPAWGLQWCLKLPSEVTVSEEVTDSEKSTSKDVSSSEVKTKVE